MINKETMMESLRYITDYELRQHNYGLQQYFNHIAEVTGTRAETCSHCAALTKQIHSHFSMFVFREISSNHPDLQLMLPELQGPQKGSNYYHQIPMWSFEILMSNIEKLSTDIITYRKRGYDVSALMFNQQVLIDYRKSKLYYFKSLEKQQEEVKAIADTLVDAVEEVKTTMPYVKRESSSIIDESILLVMKEEGKTNVECAEYFGVSKQAIGKCLKRINRN